MAQEQVNDIALMSIKPIYVDAILSGEKKVEFRKQRFKRNVEYVVIYSTSPVKRIVGYFSISYIKTARPNELWKEYEEIAGLDEPSFREYFRGHEHAVAIEIGDVTNLLKPFPLSEIFKEINPPRSFCYISKNSFERLMAKISRNS
jgi:predicted transcriptional regulator